MTDQKIAIVTGANNGIGFETAIGMSDMQKRIPDGQFTLLMPDLSEFASVRDFAMAFRGVTICNRGKT